jgi:hypothetical protein
MWKILERVTFVKAFVDLMERKVITKGFNVDLRDYDELIEAYEPYVGVEVEENTDEKV